MILVAGQTPLAEVGDLFRRVWNLVRVVARHAAETALARAEAPAGFHLLDLPHELLPLAGRGAVVDEKLGQGQARAIIDGVAAQAVDAPIADQVALLADVSAEDGVEVPWVDDRQVTAARRLLALRVELAGTVTALAADRMAQEDRLLVTVRGEGDGLEAVGMTEQAIGSIGRSKCTLVFS